MTYVDGYEEIELSLRIQLSNVRKHDMDKKDCKIKCISKFKANGLRSNTFENSTNMITTMH